LYRKGLTSHSGDRAALADEVRRIRQRTERLRRPG
jgi:hypothetical protein